MSTMSINFSYPYFGFLLLLACSYIFFWRHRFLFLPLCMFYVKCLIPVTWLQSTVTINFLLVSSLVNVQFLHFLIPSISFTRHILPPVFISICYNRHEYWVQKFEIPQLVDFFSCYSYIFVKASVSPTSHILPWVNIPIYLSTVSMDSECLDLKLLSSLISSLVNVF